MASGGEIDDGNNPQSTPMAANAKVNDIPKPKGEEITQGVEDFKFERRMRVLEPLYASAGAPLCRLKPSLNLEGLPERLGGKRPCGV